MLRKLLIPKFFLFFTLLLLSGVIVVVSYTALSASNVIPATRLGLNTQSIIPNNLKPSECTMNISNIVYCTGGTCTGTNSNDLMLGTTGVDNIRGRQGDDCILGGGGDDDLRGNNGNDVCLGGPGNNNYLTCEYTSP